jgi:nicotinamidase-related amidase
MPIFSFLKRPRDLQGERRNFMKASWYAVAGGVAATTAASAHNRSDSEIGERSRAPKRLRANQCCGVIVDVQGAFLSELDGASRYNIARRTGNFGRLLSHFKIPIVVTLEKPVTQKGSLPIQIGEQLGDAVETFEKSYFDLTKEKPIRSHLAQLQKKQIVVVGCETDVCVLESTLGLLGLGYEVFAVEDLLFSTSKDVGAAMHRMKTEGVTFLTYKTLYYELTEKVEAGETAGANGLPGRTYLE